VCCACFAVVLRGVILSIQVFAQIATDQRIDEVARHATSERARYGIAAAGHDLLASRVFIALGSKVKLSARQTPCNLRIDAARAPQCRAAEQTSVAAWFAAGHRRAPRLANIKETRLVVAAILITHGSFVIALKAMQVLLP
jgi:hypothetical protein